MRDALPTGTVTFLVTDIEGSTRLVQSLGDARATEVFKEHRRLLHDAIAARGGRELQDRGDGFVFVFKRASDAIGSAVAAQRAVIAHTWPDGTTLRVRMGHHTGEPTSTSEGYVGVDIHRAARICAVAWGGQILLSQTTRDLVEGDLPAGVELRDLGPHRLKDLARPIQIYQVMAHGLPSEYPPLNSLDNLANNLPIQLTSFVGREPQMADVRRLLGTTRLLTLTGVGGCGKTRLALQAAAELLEEFADGVWVVELASLVDPSLVAQAVAKTLGLQPELVPEDFPGPLSNAPGPHQGRSPGRSPVSILTDYLRARHILLILDNSEHVIAACADLADQLLRVCAHLRIIATSREALGVGGELTYPVPTLSLPEARERAFEVEHIRRSEAVRLFVERAAFARPGFTLTAANAPAVIQICRRLDGIPLAIELAAARTNALSLDDMAARLDDRFRLATGGSRTALPRHQTLEAAIDWSHALLTQPERVQLRRLSVFAGGFGITAAEAICAGDGVAEQDVLYLLARLVEKSLVAAEGLNGQTRYRLLEIVRQYARERLLESGEEEAVRRRHLEWYLALAEEGQNALSAPDQGTWLNRLDQEHDDVLAALEWALANKHADLGLRLASALWNFWRIRGYYNEGRRWLHTALERSIAPTSTRATALAQASFFASLQGDFQQAAALAEEGLALARSMGPRDMQSLCLVVLGEVALDAGAHERALKLYETGLGISRDLGDKPGMAIALHDLGYAARFQGDYALAEAHFAESHAVCQEVGDKEGVARALRGIANLAREQGDYNRAARLYQEALNLYRQLGARFRVSAELINLGVMARLQGDYTRARATLEEALSQMRDLGDRAGIAETLTYLATVWVDLADLGRATALCEEAMALCREAGLELHASEVRRLLGRVAMYQGDYARATELLQGSLRFFRERRQQLRAAYTLSHLGDVARAQGDLPRAAALHRDSLRALATAGHKRGVCFALEGLAAVALAQGASQRAAALFGAAAALREQVGTPLQPADRPDYDRAIATLRSALGEAAFEAAWGEGRSWPLEQTVSEGLKASESRAGSQQ